MSSPGGVILEHPRTATWGAFCVWVLVGAALAFGLLSFILPFAVIAILVTALAAVFGPSLRQSWFGALSGAGALLLYVAYLNRLGPGTVCWQTARESGCDEYGNPLPWLVVGLALVLIGVLAQVRRKRLGP